MKVHKNTIKCVAVAAQKGLDEKWCPYYQNDSIGIDAVFLHMLDYTTIAASGQLQDVMDLLPPS